MKPNPSTSNDISFDDFKSQIIEDYKVAVTSRECSLMGRREVLSGKAKFGIFGDGKELPQLAMARAFQNGDFRSGYYRDQTFMMALDYLNPKEFFHGLYATTDLEKEPMSAGRQMGGHFVTHSVNEDGSWKNLTEQKNSSADISCTAGQMPRLVGLAQASKIYRNVEGIDQTNFSKNGNEVAWGTIGNASTSEGHFFEAINAAGVMQIPMVICIWDDEYGISVPSEYHTTKGDISEALSGLQRDEDNKGFEILKVKGWDYTALIHTFENASDIAREGHVPVIIHVTELTQPQGHSTSGSHERYKSAERLEWEKEHDCNKMFREWIIENGISSEDELKKMEREIKQKIRAAKKDAWSEFLQPHLDAKKQLVQLLDNVAAKSPNRAFILKVKNDLIAIEEPLKKDLASKSRKVLRYLLGENTPEKQQLQLWINNFFTDTEPKYSSNLYSELPNKATNIKAITPTYSDSSKEVDGRVILRDNFDTLFSRYPEALVFGEDTGNIGDVNQGLEGLQKKYGKLRVADTGIRETSIIGQGIGMALRGLRPIAEIQYLDYILYAIQTLSDDLASLMYRTVGKQKAPLIVRTRGHRLEGIWHSGSPMGGLVHLLRGMYILTPRNMTQAAGFYNTLMKSDEPALIIESLNGYRLKEKMPSNLGEFCTPIGKVETMKEGTDITILSYGSTLRIVESVANDLLEVGIDAEVIDAQSLLPFDLEHDVVKSLQKTNRLLVVDEDVPGGCSAYLLQEVVENQGGYKYLDSAPQTLTAKAHRPAYASDGDYFSKPNAEDIFEKVYEIMHEVDPKSYPPLR
ncbi:alpha-ketoacid dehydrogenase subunit alpha/beta [Flagellimonas zhangzhouensis]|uniref:3-methyl-2-oxobutanoate dehydrogenase (2-methylpropanoyl-transferring) n=1 Tax=Flagellimonas zhangzhouensis TaxID=1073328 RepID=A0A1H2SBX8_9FLAO|nr:alpha-ketoacid dehydrogenase subunit alpha/beta [Allomuricauda zhangzhouensis]SDQ73046.1 Pyruvate/2-oxoglutarate/acetoin dehydrogenase complex, dehydrogenase (E1) component [Allomuricauda zhangzhouensis]SDW29018.1 Pyruvate/2-oxoglutarate/acetoin dehydrogenase complex, dehydrogenase (E1) component [Allomuricauda zhangzhouensis]